MLLGAGVLRSQFSAERAVEQVFKAVLIVSAKTEKAK